MNIILNKLETYIALVRNNKKYLYIAVILISVIAAIFFTSSNDDIEFSDTNDMGSASNNQEENVTSTNTIYVDISGAVKNPGVYEMESNSRIFQVIEKAGGLTSKADVQTINQAEVVNDGQKIVIPKKGAGNSDVSKSDLSSNLININTADLTELQQINGVGPVTAQKIIDYRSSNGNFTTIEGIKNVSGIGEKTFIKISPYICI